MQLSFNSVINKYIVVLLRNGLLNWGFICMVKCKINFYFSWQGSETLGKNASKKS